MHVSPFNGTRLGAFVQTLLYLTGVPKLFEPRHNTGEVSMKTGGRSGFTLDALDPKPHPEDPDNSQCYGILGCIRSKYVEQRGFKLFPEPIRIIKPDICLQTYRNRSCQTVDPETIPILKASPGPTSYWVTHGYIDNGHRPWTNKMAHELLEADNSSNVFIIDWTRGAQPPYSQATVNVELLGAYVANLMIKIQDTHALPISAAHFIGHSLGAHFGGFVGSWLLSKGFLLARISGLDPAQPYFQHFPLKVRLDPADASFVDVIHTDAKPLLDGGSLSGLGTQETSGHVDFYPNAGKNQPGCTDGMYQAILQEKGSLIYGLRRFFACDHMRSYELFTESIRAPCLFLSFACASWDAFVAGSCIPTCDDGDVAICNRMGFHARKPHDIRTESANETRPSNIYFSLTGDRSPYCREHYRVSLELGSKPSFRSNSDLNLVILGQQGVLDKVKLGARHLRDSNTFQYLVPGHGFRTAVEKMIMKPTVTNALWWIVNKLGRHQEIDVASVSLQSLERHRTFVLCPAGPPVLRMSEESNILLTSTACNSTMEIRRHLA